MYTTPIEEQGFSEFDEPPYVDEHGHGDECLCWDCKEARDTQYQTWLAESAQRITDVQTALLKREREAA